MSLESGVGHLEDLLGTFKAGKLVFSEVHPADPGWRVVKSEFLGGERHNDLAAMGACEQACRPVQGGAEPVVASGLGSSGVQGHPGPQRCSWTPRLAGEGQLGCDSAD